MTSSSLLAFSAALFSGVLAVAAPFRKRHSLASWLFFAGMATLALESFFGGMSLPYTTCGGRRVLAVLCHPNQVLPSGILARLQSDLFAWQLSRVPHEVEALFGSSIPPSNRSRALLSLRNWFTFFLRVNAGQGWGLSFGQAGKIVNILCLIAAVMALNNLEKTFRSAVGTMRWRIKFLILGLAVIFASRIYSLSQDMLYPAHDLTLTDFESAALLVGCALITIAYLRNGFAEIDVYPSHSVLQGTITVVLAGGYLFAVGLLAQFITFLGGTGSFRTQALPSSPGNRRCSPFCCFRNGSV